MTTVVKSLVRDLLVTDSPLSASIALSREAMAPILLLAAVYLAQTEAFSIG
jgi:hypothetical protein